MITHILNGDSLKEQFPADHIAGELIVTRECLVDGDVSGSTPEELFKTRAASMQEMYGTSQKAYFNKAVPELTRIIKIASDEVNLWFEEDLFCQVNLWFVCSLLTGKEVAVFLVTPEMDLRYGFSGLTQDELVSAWQNRQPITHEQLEQFAALWKAYQSNNISDLEKVGSKLNSDFPFLNKTIIAQKERASQSGKPGKPERLLLEIMEEKGDENFGPVFQEFVRRAPIYGFGDLQVKRLFDQLKGN